MTSTDLLVQAAKLAYHRASADLHRALARSIEADMKRDQDDRDTALLEALGDL